MGIGNLGVSELLVVALLVLLLFGPRRLPEIGRTVGSVLREFRRGMNEVRRELDRMDPDGWAADRDDRPDRRPPAGRVEPPGADEPEPPGSSDAAGPERAGGPEAGGADGPEAGDADPGAGPERGSGSGHEGTPDEPPG